MSTSRYAPGRVVRAVGGRLYSAAPPSVVLRRDLELPLQPPRAKIPITVRSAEAADAPTILRLVSELQGYDRSNRELFLDLRIGTCYLAVTEQGEICYAQWLIAQEHSRLLERHTNLPTPKHREALLENAFTPAAFRGQGIMSAAMAEIAARASALGARWVLTVVSERNVASIKGCTRAGFEPYMLKLDRWRLLRHEVRYVPLPPGYGIGTSGEARRAG
jgi:GNAT superfamily N-acetyltransferase